MAATDSNDSSLPRRKTAHIICGSPGCGKSTYGSELAASTSSILLDIDTCTERLIVASLSSVGRDPTDRDSPWFKETYRQPIYDTLFAIAAENLKHVDAVIVGPFTKEIRDATWLEHLSSRLVAEVKVHYIFCRAEVRRQRLIDRANPRDTSKLLDWAAHSEYYDGEHAPVFDHIPVDTS
jgi:adenylate kinase family enzyme